MVGKEGENKNDQNHRKRAQRLLQHGIRQEMIEEMIGCVPSRKMAPNMSFKDFIALKEKDEIRVGIMC